MADTASASSTGPAHIEAIQAAKAEEARVILHALAVHHLLAVLDPQPGDATLDYRGLLQRAENVIAKALQQLGA